MTLAPGIHQVPADQYHADALCDVPTLSAGTCRLLANSTPLHAWANHPRLNPELVREDKAIFDLGTVAHSVLLEDSDESVVVVAAADWRKKDAQEQRDEARADGKVPLLTKDWERVEEMVAAVRSQLEARGDDPPLLTDGVAEPTLLWEERGVMCRARFDWLRHDLAAADDLKTTGRTANPTVWGRKTLWAIGADVQVAFYLRGLKVLTGAEPVWRYVVVENFPPYALSVVALDSGALELGQAKVDRAIDRWRECLTAGRWPGYPEPIYYAELPAWEETRWLENDAEALTA